MTRDRAKGARESTVICEAAVESDLGNARIGFSQEARACCDAGFGDELHRADAMDAFDRSREASGAHVGFSSE